LRIERQVQIAQQPVNILLDVTGYEQGPLRATVHAADDALELDDTAYWVVPPHRPRRVLLVTRGNEALADALRALPGVALSVAQPTHSARLPPFDSYVFDRYTPPQPPPAGALLFQPSATAWLPARWHEETAPVITAWDDAHPLTAGVAWSELRLGRARLADRDAGSALVAAAGTRRDGGLVLAGRAQARWLAVGIGLADSNFPLQPGLPVFLGNALDWLAERPAVTSAGLGRIEVPMAQAQVRDVRAGAVAATATPKGILFEARRPGIFVAGGPREQRVVVANATDPRTVRINATRLAAAPVHAGRSEQPTWSWFAPWRALLAFAFVVLALEWPAFCRRITE
jgi:hypothetical protein